MNKKNICIILASILVIVIVIAICLIPKNYKVGDTIKIDSIKLQLKRAELAKKLQSGGYNNSFMPFTGSSSTKTKEASKGHTYVSFSVKIQNISEKKISLEDEFSSDNIIIEYKGNKYYTTGPKSETQECKDNCYESGYAVWKNKKGVDIFKSFNYMSYELNKDEELKDLRIYLDLPVEVKDLKDSFKLIFEFKNNNKTKQYVYKIN